MDIGEFFEKVHPDVYGGGLLYDPWWRDKEDEEVRIPLEVAHSYPDFPTKGSGDGGYSCPIVEHFWCLCIVRELLICLKPVGKVALPRNLLGLER